MGEVISIANKRTWKDFDKKYAALHEQGVANIIARGRLLIEAEEELDDQEYIKWTEQSKRFSRMTAHMLKAIAKHPIVSNVNHGLQLPLSWRTLFELTRLPHDTLLARLKDGTITPETQRRVVLQLIQSSKPKAKKIKVKKNKIDQGGMTAAAESSLSTARTAYVLAMKNNDLDKEQRIVEINKMLDLTFSHPPGVPAWDLQKTISTIRLTPRRTVIKEFDR